MKKKTVTKSLKKTLKKLGIKHEECFSDPRKNKEAVGVKFCRLDLNQKQIDKVVKKMEKKGFKFIKVTPRKYSYRDYYGGFSGIRFTFYKHLTNC
jgi:hypothetical protein